MEHISGDLHSWPSTKYNCAPLAASLGHSNCASVHCTLPCSSLLAIALGCLYCAHVHCALLLYLGSPTEGESTLCMHTVGMDWNGHWGSTIVMSSLSFKYPVRMGFMSLLFLWRSPQQLQVQMHPLVDTATPAVYTTCRCSSWSLTLVEQEGECATLMCTVRKTRIGS